MASKSIWRFARPTWSQRRGFRRHLPPIGAASFRAGRLDDGDPAPIRTTQAPVVMRVLSRFDRQSLASFITVAIELLDVVDGDSDTEPNGDELDGNPSEDEFMIHRADGPGCPIAETDKAVDDDACDPLVEGGI